MPACAGESEAALGIFILITKAVRQNVETDMVSNFKLVNFKSSGNTQKLSCKNSLTIVFTIVRI